MRIGIVTQTLANNYGGILQNYALQQYLKQLGHEPITIDFKRPPVDYHTYLLAFVKAIIAYFIPSKRRPFPRRDINRRTQRNEMFVSKHIARTKLVENYSPELIEEYKLDAIIVGSDQVWRPEYNYSLEDMFLRFAEKSEVVKLVYAASFGVDQWEYTEEQTNICRDLCRWFKAVSVREYSGVVLCKEHLNIKAVEMIDPTMLLLKDEYEELCKDVPEAGKNILAAYVLDINKDKQDFITTFAKSNKLHPVIFRADLSCSLTIEEWVAMFRDAKYVITDSFHGTVFSILFNKPFLAVANNSRGSSRFQNLLDKFNLTDRLIDPSISICSMKDIDWNEVNGTISYLKVDAYTYLTSNLKCQ